MKLFILEPRAFGISKYLVYFIILFFLLRPVARKIWYALTYTRTEGKVVFFEEYEYYTSKGRRVAYYPVVEFTVDQQKYRCFGSRFQKDAVNIDMQLPVIYDPKNISNAYVYTFLGYWGPNVAFLAPVVLFVSLMFLGLDSVPRFLTLKI